MNEFILDKSTLIGGWYMPEELCDDIIKYYNSNTHLQYKGVAGSVGGGRPTSHKTNSNVKDSTDIMIYKDDISEPFGSYRLLLQECLDNYIKKYEYVSGNNKFNINELYNIQYYEIGGGFKKWHFENSERKDRLLVFMTYLNDIEDGGTEFKYQGLTTPAKKGLTLIWPASWTHTHKGQISNTKEKYIVTGWYSFNDA